MTMQPDSEDYKKFVELVDNLLNKSYWAGEKYETGASLEKAIAAMDKSRRDLIRWYKTKER